MVKERLFIVISLCFLLVTEGLSQKFNYNSQKKTKSVFNEELASALHDDDCRAMGRILSKDPSLVDAASSEIEQSKRLKIKTTVPLICDAVQRCLDMQCSVKMVETILSYHPNLNCKFDGLPPFYMVLDYIACHRISECERAEELFYSFLNKSNIDIGERPPELPPTFSYLLTENFKYLKGHFSQDYISPELIKAFVDKGASINTNDVNSISILSFATITENHELMDYCLDRDANLTSANKWGKDPFYYAVANDDFLATKKILDNGYPLTEQRFVQMDMRLVVAQAGNNIHDLLFDNLKGKYKTFSDFKILFEYFPNHRHLYLSDGFDRSQLDVTWEELSHVIDMAENFCDDETAKTNLLWLKKEYIAESKDLKTFGKSLDKYPIFPFKYSDDYYEKESTYNALMVALQDLSFSFSPSAIDHLSQEAKEKKRSFVNEEWKGKPLIGKKVADGYPSMYNTIVEELYNEIAKMSPRTEDYSNARYSYEMKTELKDLRHQIDYCHDFISGFGDSSYGEQTEEKLHVLHSRYNFVQDQYKEWEGSVFRAKGKLSDLKKEVLKRGRTPNYETRGSWKDVGKKGLLSVFGQSYNRVSFKLDLGNYHSVSDCELYQGQENHKYSVSIGHCTSYSANYNSDNGETTDIGLAIREALWVFCYQAYENGNKDENDLIDLVDFLEKNKNGAWWGYEYR